MSIFRALPEEISALEELAKAQDFPLFDAELPEVLLLHGYFLGKGSLQGLAVHLQNSYDVARVDYPSLQDLEKTTQQLLAEIKTITDLRGEAISLVGHSMGGLVATRIAQEYPAAVKKVIALGTPFYGTFGAYTQYPLHLMCSLSSYFLSFDSLLSSHSPGSPTDSSILQMLPNSRFIRNLQEKGFPESVQFFSLYSSDDFVVLPWWSPKLPKQENTCNIQISDVGHLGLLGKRCYGIVEKVLTGEKNIF